MALAQVADLVREHGLDFVLGEDGDQVIAETKRRGIGPAPEAATSSKNARWSSGSLPPKRCSKARNFRGNMGAAS